MQTNFYQDLKPQTGFVHLPSKTITESDNNIFCLLTMNHHPVHLDREHAAWAHHGKILVAGTLVFSLTVGLTVPDISFNAIANLGYENIEHINPVFIGDTIKAHSHILEARESKTNPNNGIVTLETTGFKDHQKIPVIKFKRTILIPKRNDY